MTFSLFTKEYSDHVVTSCMNKLFLTSHFIFKIKKLRFSYHQGHIVSIGMVLTRKAAVLVSSNNVKKRLFHFTSSIHMCVCLYIHMYICVYIYVYTFVYVYVYKYIYIRIYMYREKSVSFPTIISKVAGSNL